MQDADDETIPEDVAEKIPPVHPGRPGSCHTHAGQELPSIGGVSMGIAGSMVDQSFFEDYLGMRCESVDMTEIYRRISEGIYDHDEFVKASSGRSSTARKAQTSIKSMSWHPGTER